MRKLILAVVVALTASVDAQAEEEALTTDDVMAMVALVPTQLGHGRPAGFEKAKDAREIAAAVAKTADGSLLGSVRADAGLMVTFAAYESGMRKFVSGDGGSSRGPWQIQRISWKDANTPETAARAWLAAAQISQKICEKNPPEERLAALASGSCDRGRMLVRRRVEVARRIALMSAGEGE